MGVLLSIKEKWADLILSGEKTIELRKSAPTKERTPFKVYLYKTADSKTDGGTVVGEATCAAIKRLWLWFDKDVFRVETVDKDGKPNTIYSAKRNKNGVVPVFCVTQEEFISYAYRDGDLYALVLENPRRYSEPRPVNLFADNNGEPIKRAPQSWCYAYGTDLRWYYEHFVDGPVVL